MKTYCRKEDADPLVWGMADPNFFRGLGEMSNADRVKTILNRDCGERLAVMGDIARF